MQIKTIKNKKENTTFSEIIIYNDANNNSKVEVFLKDENIWLNQDRIATLFGVQRPAITKHLKNIFEEKELDENSVSSILEQTAEDNKKYKVKFYNLEAIISIGYRVNSSQAIVFRNWATAKLKEYIIKGFVMDDERLKNPEKIFGKDYFEEQLARIRDIRSSERRFYLKITDIYAQCSADYKKDSETTKEFFATVQNKLHFAITGQTAAEIIQNRVNSKKENMGLTTWKNAPNGKIRESDVVVAKNYLNEKELDNLNRIVSLYLDYADFQAKNGVVMYMKDWIEKLNNFLKFNEKDILQNAGKVSHSVAEALAVSEYTEFNKSQKIESDFERVLLNKIEK